LKLIRLYAQGVDVSEELAATIARRTENVSGAFIKELMRRSLQYRLERDGDGAGTITLADVEPALQEILISGGSLNRKLLGVMDSRAEQTS
jgi:hypothetical protein